MDLLEKAQASVPQIEGTLNVKGLSEKVEVIRDSWGVPHIYAQNLPDLFFAQGYVTAQDRLIQMELIRRVGSGSLAEIMGEGALNSDIHYRTIGMKRVAEREAKKFMESNEEHKELVLAYYEGINQYISDNADKLVIKLVLQYIPREFTVTDGLLTLLIVASGLCVNWENELLRMDLIEKLGDYRTIDLERLNLPQTGVTAAGLKFFRPNELASGSNNWVVSGEKSVTGSPLLANDPHLPLSLPSFWYQIHLSAPGFNVVGVSIAGTPGIVLGHNDYIAWGVTNSFADVQDLFIEKINPENPSQYLFKGKWKEMEIITEEINVRGRDEPLKKQIGWTHHGPLLELFPVGITSIDYKKLEKNDRLALQYVQNESKHSGSVTILIHLNMAKNWEEFKKALKLLTLPSQNFVYADINGNIGYHMNGLVPIRKKGSGLVPVPGWTGEYEWTGYIPFEELPQNFNPPSHYITTANNKIVSDYYPYLVSNDFSLSDRVNRISELLTEKHKLGLEDFKRIQADVRSQRAQEIVQYLVAIHPETEEQKEAIKLLKTWDYKLHTDSAAAFLYKIWVRKLTELLFKDKLGEDLYFRFSLRAPILQYLKYPSNFWFPGKSDSNVVKRDTMILQALDEALKDAMELQGKNFKKWRWGEAHSISFNHPLAGVNPALEPFLNRGPYELPGDGFTVNAFSNFPINDYKCYAGVSYRQIIDLGDFSKSMFIIAPGQSEHPLSEHYDDLIELWQKGKYQPMLFNRKDVEKNKKHMLELIPDQK